MKHRNVSKTVLTFSVLIPSPRPLFQGALDHATTPENDRIQAKMGGKKIASFSAGGSLAQEFAVKFLAFFVNH